MMKNQAKRNQYLYRKSYLDRRLQNDFMENGVAYIPCRIKSIDDVISKYSVKDCESLDAEFFGCSQMRLLVCQLFTGSSLTATASAQGLCSSMVMTFPSTIRSGLLFTLLLPFKLSC